MSYMSFRVSYRRGSGFSFGVATLFESLGRVVGRRLSVQRD